MTDWPKTDSDQSRSDSRALVPQSPKSVPRPGRRLVGTLTHVDGSRHREGRKGGGQQPLARPWL